MKKKDQKRVTVWVEAIVKEEAEAILKQLGLTPTSIINLLYKQIIYQRKVPFEIRFKDDTNGGSK
jgi:DNA-damage-inducible protein J